MAGARRLERSLSEHCTLRHHYRMHHACCLRCQPAQNGPTHLSLRLALDLSDDLPVSNCSRKPAIIGEVNDAVNATTRRTHALDGRGGAAGKMPYLKTAERGGSGNTKRAVQSSSDTYESASVTSQKECSAYTEAVTARERSGTAVLLLMKNNPHGSVAVGALVSSSQFPISIDDIMLWIRSGGNELGVSGVSCVYVLKKTLSKCFLVLGS